MRRTLRPCLIVFVALVWLVLDAAPAWAHAEFEDDSVPANSDTELVIKVPVEEEGTSNVDVQVAMADGWQAIGCQAQPSWTCKIEVTDGRQTVHFTKAAGAAAGEDERFSFTVHSAAGEGTAAFPTVQTYGDGEVVRWIGEPGTDNPAPRVELTPGPPLTAAPTTASTPAPSGPGTSTVSIPAASSTTSASSTSASSTASTAATSTAASDEPGVTSTVDDDGGASGWLWLLLVVVLVAIAAAAAYVYRRTHRPPPPTEV
jgi:uncharacterized protein YcnI